MARIIFVVSENGTPALLVSSVSSKHGTAVPVVKCSLQERRNQLCWCVDEDSVFDLFLFEFHVNIFLVCCSSSSRVSDASVYTILLADSGHSERRHRV